MRIDAGDRLEEIQIIGLPNYKKQSDVRRVIKHYEKQASGHQPDKPVLKSTLKKRITVKS